MAFEEKCEFIPFLEPFCFHSSETGYVTGVEFYRTKQLDNGSWVADKEMKCLIEADFVITAFGSQLNKCKLKALKKKLHRCFSQIKNQIQITLKGREIKTMLKSEDCVLVDQKMMKTIEPGVFAGGDVTGACETTVEAVNDGKTAAWFIHEYLQVIIHKIHYLKFQIKEKKHNCFALCAKVRTRQVVSKTNLLI